MKNLIQIILFFLLAATAFGQSGTHLQVQLVGIGGITNGANRTVFMRPMSVPGVNGASVLLGEIYQTNTDGAGQFIFSNAVAPMLYLLEVLPPPGRTAFMVYLPTNGMGLVQASAYLVANSTATFPAGSVAWSAAVTDQRYVQNIGQAASTNIAYLNGTNLFIGTNRFTVNVDLIGTGNTASNQTFAAANLLTGSLGDARYLQNSAFTAATNIAFQSGTNAFRGSNFFAGGVALPSLAAGKLLATDSITNLSTVTIGSGVQFNSSTLTLSSSGGAGTGWLVGGNTATASGIFGTTDTNIMDMRVNNFCFLYADRDGNDVPAITFGRGGNSGNFITNPIANSVLGGIANIISAFVTKSSIVGGEQNQIINLNGVGHSIIDCTILGGNQNLVKQDSSESLVFGQSCTVQGNASIALGSGATATNNHDFVWSDGTATAATAANQFIVQSSAGLGVNTNNPSSRALFVNGSASFQVWNISKTTTYAIGSADIGAFFDNVGALGTVNISLPTAQRGLHYSFLIQNAHVLTITATASGTIRIAGSVSAANGNITASTVGNAVHLVAVDATEWIADSHEGTWTVN